MEAVNLMRGPVNTNVEITIRRKGLKKAKNFTIRREIIEIRSVVSKLIDNKVGYLRLRAFNENSSGQLKKEIKKLEKAKNLVGYIFDLRNNPGGLLSQAVKISDFFLNDGEIVSTRGRKNRENRKFFANEGDQISGKPLLVLINNGSASASEIVAGALQDHNRAIIVGTITFGKGSVQTLYPINKNNLYFPNSKNLGALKLTTAEYFTPRGRSIQAEGIEPDFVIKQEPTKENNPEIYEVGETQLNEFIKKDSNDKSESGSSAYIPLDSSEDTQLNLAVEIMNDLLLKI